MKVSERELDTYRPTGLEGSQWEELKFCNLPWHQLKVALTKDILPREVVKQYTDIALKAKDKNIVILLGSVGVGKTVMGIRYMVRCLYEGMSPPLYLSHIDLKVIMDGRLGIELDYHDALRAYQTRLKHPYAIEKENYVALEDVCSHYGVVMIDDFSRPHYEIISDLIEKAYQTNCKLVLTSNDSPEDLKEGLPERVRSRLREHGVIKRIVGRDLRGGEDE